MIIDILLNTMDSGETLTTKTSGSLLMNASKELVEGKMQFLSDFRDLV